MEVEGTEQNIILQPEGMIVGAVTSVNGQTGDVVLTTSDLENTSDYQTGQDVQDAIAGKQDTLTAGSNIQISEQNVISATDTTYSAGSGINISNQNAISVDTTVVATQQNLSDEVTNRENADIYLQGQIDAISASSNVVDIVGTYADLQAYDTQHLKDNDIIKVLQDETQGDATTYYRWSTHTQTFTLIGQEGPYYTKAGADAQFVPQTRTVNGKALSTNITLNASDVSALGTSDVAQTTGSSTSMVMSQKATTDALGTKLNITDYVVDTQLADSDNPVQNRVLNGLLGDMPSDFFSGSATTSPTASTSVQFGNILGLDDVQLLGNTTQATTTGKNLINGAYSEIKQTVRCTAEESGNGFKITSTASSGAVYAMVPILNIAELLGKTVTVSYVATGSGIRARFFYYNSSWSATDSVGNSETVTLPTSIAGYAGIGVIFYTTNNSSATYTNIQLEIGSTATSYEPYTGGIPAPNPDYPQDIDVVTGEQTVEVHGKNIVRIGTYKISGTNYGLKANYGNIKLTSTTTNNSFDLNAGTRIGGYLPSYGQANDYHLTGLGGTYTVSAQNLVNRSSGSGNVILQTFTNKRANGRTITTTATSVLPVTISLDDDEYIKSIYIWTPSSSTIDMEMDIQLEEGSTDTTYQPYQSQSYTINLGSIELCKISDYQDYIYKSGDDWYVHKALGKYVFNGSETIAYNSSNHGFTINSTNLANYLTNLADPPLVGLCTHFKVNSTTSTWVSDNTVGLSSVGTFWCKATSFATSQSDCETWLTNNTPTIYYGLATATDTKITDATLISELEAVLNASTYGGETDIEITATGTNLSAPLQITAVNANAKGIVYKLRA